MTMGERIRQARIEAGLSQRQLAGDTMTRNMLSQLENGSANPSVATLRYLSEKLCKPMSYFLGEDAPKIPEGEEMEQARAAFASGEYKRCLEMVEGLTAEAFRLERELLEALAAMELARQAIREKRLPYANTLLQRSRKAGEKNPYFGEGLQRKWLVLAAQVARKPSERAALIGRIPQEDEVLLLKAQVALEDGNAARAEKLLEAVEKRENGWQQLRGEVHFRKKEYAEAAKCYHRIEKEMNVDQKLEVCYREMGDYKMAYYYATKK